MQDAIQDGDFHPKNQKPAIKMRKCEKVSPYW